MGRWVCGYGTLIGTNQTQKWIQNSKSEEWVSKVRISTTDLQVSQASQNNSPRVGILYTLSHFQCHFSELEVKLKAEARMSLLPRFSEERPTSFSLELCFELWKMSLEVGQAVPARVLFFLC